MIRHVKPLKLFKQKRKADYWPVLFAILFTLFGLLMVFESSNVVAFKDFGDKYYFIKEQFKWLLIGLVGLGLTSFISYKNFYKLSFPLLIVTLMSLVAVFIPGLGIKTLGASRW